MFEICNNDLSQEKQYNIFKAFSAIFDDICNKALQKYQNLNKTEIVNKLKFYYNKYYKLFSSSNELRNIYLNRKVNASKDNLELECIINEKKNKKLNTEYKALLKSAPRKKTPYSELSKTINGYLDRLIVIEDELDASLKNLGNLYDDEVRAREQLDEIQGIGSIESFKYAVVAFIYRFVPGVGNVGTVGFYKLA